MPDTPLSPDALEAGAKAMYETMSLPGDWSWEKLRGDQAFYRDIARAVVSAYLAVAQPVAQKITDAEWQAFQAIPDQGYSHRSWVDARIAERVAVAQPEVTSFDPRVLNRKGWTCGCEPGNYDSCDECRSACNELANFLNRPGVNDA